MQDPSQGVDPRLLPHLHLVVIPNLPKQHSVNEHFAIDFLQRAPQMVKDRPVSWQYIGPQDSGTTFLEWIHPNRPQYPSDGFAWLDPEQAYEKEYSDQYVLDVLVHSVGVLPEQRPPVAFKRIRYRMRPKRIGTPPFDPSFWLVHYAYADPLKQQEVSQGYQIPPHIINIIQHRRNLEMQGVPQRKDFMLVDRTSWPQVLFPQMARSVPAYAGRGQMPMGQQASYPYPGAQAQPAGPPAKRARQTGPAQLSGAVPAPPVTLAHDPELELLEDTSGGDYLDHISPAAISRDRFKRHHLWLEEVFSSLYSMKQILPEDLGFGLVGELGELTKGILNPPTKKILTEQERAHSSALQDPQINTSSVYKHLDPEQFAEFEKRVAEFVEARNLEMDAMREKHAKVIARVNKGRFYVEAEQRLREAGLDSAKIDEVVKEVELKMGVPLLDRQDVVCVQKGTLVDEEKQINGTDGLKDQVNGQSNASEDATAGLLDELMNTEAETPTESVKDVVSGENISSNDALDLIEGMDLDIPSMAATENPPVAGAAIEQPSTDVNAATIPPSTVTLAEATLSETTKTTAPTATATDLVTDMLDEVENVNDVLQAESMFDNEDFSAFDNITGDDEMGVGFGTGDGDGLLDFDGAFGAETGAADTQP